jgi:hypothetical protein
MPMGVPLGSQNKIKLQRNVKRKVKRIVSRNRRERCKEKKVERYRNK